MKRIALLTILFGTVGCSTTNYRYVDSLKKDFNSSYPKDPIFIKIQEYNPSKKIFKKLDGKISNEFVYIFTWINHMPTVGTKHFNAIIYDYKTKKNIMLKMKLAMKKLK